MFYPGDRVILTDKRREGACDNCCLLEGMIGTVVEEADVIDGWISVAWDDNVLGHDCSGRAPGGHGWRVHHKAVELVSDELDEIDEQEFLSLI